MRHRPLGSLGGRSSPVVAVVFIALAAGACGGPFEPPGVCDEEDRAQIYTPGMTQSGERGALRVQLQECTPAPPARGDNSWTIRVTTAGGEPVDGASIEVEPFMPDHGHGATILPEVTSAGSGAYTLDPLDLRMPGLWEIRIDLEADTGAGAPTTDRVVFSFCVEG